MNSPYAAPHTPIASAKRPRIATKGTSSKVPPPAPSADSSALTPQNNTAESQLPQNRKEIGVPSPTPSKNLFSPSLRHEHHHRSRSRSGDSHSSDENDENIYLATIHSSSHDSADGSPLVGANATELHDTVDDEEIDEDEDDEFNPYLFIAGLPPHASVCIVDKICLPPQPKNANNLPTLALDLDETLVHCTVEPIAKPDLIFPVTFNGTVYQVYVRKRPYLDYFLEAVSNNFEVVVFTASQKVYADVLLNKLDPEHKYIKHRLFREACLFVQGNYLKDLHVLGRDMKKSLLVDNSPHAYSYHIDNGIPIESWYDNDKDTELLKLIGFLKRIQDYDDFRPVIREHFKTYQLIDKAKMGISIPLSAPPF